uniref:Nectin cell adhesion molecule 2 n=1 Tax=Latimeria chalumnae TaxID=7897 RepID=H3B234_LATCH
AQAQRVKVKPEVSGYEGQEVTMQCTFADANQDTKLTQNSWAKMSADGEKETVAVYNPQFGANYPLPSFQNRIKFRVQEKYPRDATLIISPLKIGDEGTYVCEFATYPHGNEEEEVKLDVLVKPTNDAKAVPVDAGESMVTVATCISANGKPASEITWRSELEGNYTNTEETGADGKITVTSWYKVVPTSKVNGMKIACEVRHKTTGSPETFPVHLSVQYPPEVRIQGYDDNWYRNRKDVQLTCEADANPPVTKYEWKLLDRTFPPSVTVGGVNEEVLHVEQVDDDLNATFICQATNALGIGDTKLKVFVRDSPVPDSTVKTGGIIGGIIAAIVVLAVLVTAILIWKRQQKNKTFGKDEEFDNPPNYKPPPPQRKVEDTDLVSPHYSEDEKTPAEESIPLRTTYFETSTVEDPTYTETPESDVWGERRNLSNILGWGTLDSNILGGGGASIREGSKNYDAPNDFEEEDDLKDDYREQVNPIYNNLSYPLHDDKESFVSEAMYV